MVFLKRKTVYLQVNRAKRIKSRTMSNQDMEAYVKQMDDGLAMAERDMLHDKASRNESIVYTDGKGHIKHALASDVLAGKVS